MAKAVVMQVTDNKNRRQDMNTRQFFFIATDAIRPAWRVIRSLPTTWLAALIVCCTVAMPRPGLAAPDQQGNQPPGAVLPDEGHAPALPAAAPHAMQPADAAAAKGGVDAQGRADWRASCLANFSSTKAMPASPSCVLTLHHLTLRSAPALRMAAPPAN